MAGLLCSLHRVGSRSINAHPPPSASLLWIWASFFLLNGGPTIRAGGRLSARRWSSVLCVRSPAAAAFGFWRGMEEVVPSSSSRLRFCLGVFITHGCRAALTEPNRAVDNHRRGISYLVNDPRVGWHTRACVCSKRGCTYSGPISHRAEGDWDNKKSLATAEGGF